MCVTSAPSRRSSPTRSACSRRSIPGSITTAHDVSVPGSRHSRRSELRRRWLRASFERQTSQRQPTRGTPRDAPVPRSVSRVAAPSASETGVSPAARSDARSDAPRDRATSSGRRTTHAGPPRSARSSPSLASASAWPFCSRGTCAALHCVKRSSRARASSQSGASFASRTRQRPLSCSTTSLLSSRSRSSDAPSSAASSIAEMTAFHSATLFVVVPIAAEMVASGSASGRSDPSRDAS